MNHQSDLTNNDTGKIKMQLKYKLLMTTVATNLHGLIKKIGHFKHKPLYNECYLQNNVHVQYVFFICLFDHLVQ